MGSLGKTAKTFYQAAGIFGLSAARTVHSGAGNGGKTNHWRPLRFASGADGAGGGGEKDCSEVVLSRFTQVFSGLFDGKVGDQHNRRGQRGALFAEFRHPHLQNGD